MVLIPFSVLYWVSYILSANGHTVFSACLLFLTGFGLFLYFSKTEHSILAPPSIFSISWIFCIGLACLKLSNLQTIWSFKTWLTFYLIYIVFVLVYQFCNPKNANSIPVSSLVTFHISDTSLFILIVVFTAVSTISFITEAIILGYIPLFTKDTPHAYSYFHISGLHYFTVLFVLVPSLCVLYLNQNKKRQKLFPLSVCCFISLFLPILLVSRFQLIFAVMLAFLTLILLHLKDWRKFLKPSFIISTAICFVCLIGLYVLITIERAHSIEYLNGIFEMKNTKTPIFITQPYIYVVNNFENFNCLVNDLDNHTFGLRMAFPLFALTGLKFIKPELVSFPLYLTKEELTTVTLFYDSYYDFGIIGCSLFAGILGFVYRKLFEVIKKGCNALCVLIYAQLTAYLILAFFTTWFSNPTTWFYLGVCLVTDILLWYNFKRNKH